MGKRVLIVGGTGAVGSELIREITRIEELERLTMLGRRVDSSIDLSYVDQHTVALLNPESYREYLSGHDAAICTLGIGEPSKVSKDYFLRIDRDLVIQFAKECRKAGVKHFSLLASVGIDAKSSSFYLRSKGELVDSIKEMGFERVSIFKPSMILTPTNRYGKQQAVVLKVWPKLKYLLVGKLRKYRGIPVEILGKAIAKNIFIDDKGIEELYWDQFYDINSRLINKKVCSSTSNKS